MLKRVVVSLTVLSDLGRIGGKDEDGGEAVMIIMEDYGRRRIERLVCHH
jgi:hypothetical protein